MKKLCGVLGIIIFFVGIIAAFILAKNLGVETDVGSFGRIEIERAWGKTILWFLGGVLATASVSCTLLGISEILQSLETLSYQMIGSQKDSWKCSNCGKINVNFIGTCDCGAKKPE